MLNCRLEVKSISRLQVCLGFKTIRSKFERRDTGSYTRKSCIYGTTMAYPGPPNSTPGPSPSLRDVGPCASAETSAAFGDGRSKKTVAIIGAGPAGLTAAKSALEVGLVPTVFERTARVGGIWNPDAVPLWPTLRANHSRFTCSFSDHNWQDDTPVFPNQQEMQAYLESYAERFLSSNVQMCMSTEVTNIQPLPTGSWQVKWKSASSSPAETSATFDHVIVASGFSSAPYFPPLSGRESSPIKVIHSVDYKGPEEFKDMHVVVAGGSFSAADIAADIVTTASKVTHVVSRPFWCMRRYLPLDLDSRAPVFLPLDLVLYRRAARTSDNEEPSIEPEGWRAFNQFLKSVLGDQGELLSPALNCGQDVPPFVAISDTYSALVQSGRIRTQNGRVAGLDGSTVLLQASVRAESVCGEVETKGDRVESKDDRVESKVDRVESEGDRIKSVGDRVESVSGEVVSSGNGVESQGDRVWSVNERVENVGERVWSEKESVESVGDRIEASVSDGIENVGAVVLCTGYRTCFPFLSPELQQQLSCDTSDTFQPLLLHKGVMHPRAPGLAFAGFYKGTFYGVMELQVRWATAIFAGLLPPPSEEEQLGGIAIEEQIKEFRPRIQFPHGDYTGLVNDLASKIDGLQAMCQQHENAVPDQDRSPAATKGTTLDDLGSKADEMLPAWRRQYDYAVPAQYRSQAATDATMAQVQGVCTKHERGAMVAAAVFRSWQGEWQLSREIVSSFPGSPSGKVTGTASFTMTSADCNEYLYREQGEFITNMGGKMRVSREYVYVYLPQEDRIEAFFAEKSAKTYLFHPLHFLPLQTASEAVPQPFTIPAGGVACGGGGACTAPDDNQEGVIDVGARWPGLMSRADVGWCAVGYHLCVKDHYNVSYKFQFAGLNLTEFEICYRVQGPQKDYISTAVYRRKQDP